MKKDSIVTILLVFNILMVSCTTLIKRQGATYDFTPLDSIISSWMDKGYYPGGAICVVKNDSVLLKRRMALSPEIQKCMSLLPASGWLLP